MMPRNPEQLRAQVRGQVITRHDDDYDSARMVHNGMFDRRPEVIVRAEDASDVAAAVIYAAERGLDLAVRGGGHSAPGFGTCDDGVVIDLVEMHRVTVDPARRIARAEGGATWAGFNDATHAHGLATTGGVISTTGVGGLTLGGGIGYLSRKHGLSIDNLLAADVVTASGDLVRASATDNADLFWALRGGGGNFGVVTAFEFELHPCDQVVAGPILYELEHARDVLELYREYIEDAPREFGGYPAFLKAPPLPFIPENRHGDTFCAMVVHWAGALDQADAELARFREVAPVVAEHVGVVPYTALNQAFDPLFPRGQRAYWKGAFVRELTDEAIDAHLRHGPEIPEISAAMHLYPINGAVHDVGATDTAFTWRDARFAAVIVAAWQNPAVDASRIGWVRDYYAALAPFSENAGYINFLDHDDAGRIRDSYAANYRRLVEIKSTWDPTNLFHVNQNIVPDVSAQPRHGDAPSSLSSPAMRRR